MSLLRNLFDFESEESRGDVLFFRLFELFIALGAMKLAWEWGAYTLRISAVVLPLGIARCVDVSFMFGSSLPLINAGVITAMVAVGFFRLGRMAYSGAFLLMLLQYATRYR